ncbi:YfhJ family protein [Metabacillus fastidiosus]|uniref:YfhJ family protein n=1 Tax=Metabacillus fastidiosus TaxID=1458 RepID=UPI002E1F0663|nr:YfhJ family protein [Metabacillus fastidiosus]MED4533133.1 YfhJ family protein [Metabacillus fastidiosus]
METYFERLTNELLKKNDFLNYYQARTWIELLWEDFETTRAQAGEQYLGKNVTEQVVLQFISNYGDKLHEFIASNPKYKDLLNSKDYLIH